MHRERLILWTCLYVLLVSCGVALWAAVYYRLPQRLWEQLDHTATQVRQAGSYRVVEVSDGDTIVVDMNGTRERIRFIGVDTPETHRPNTPVQCYGPEASSFTASQLENSFVRLEADPLSNNRDRYDRLLRYVYVGETNLNHELIKQGQGFAYVPFPFTLSEEFMSSEDAARQANLGLWGACDTKLNDGVWQTLFRE